MSEVDISVSLIDDVITMLTQEVPGVAYLGNVMAIVSAARDETNASQVNLVVRPIDFDEDLVRIEVSVRIEVISRERQYPVAITAA